MPSKECFHYRCSNRDCQARRSLPQPLAWYKRVPKCRRCRGQKWWFDRTYRKRRNASTCECMDGAPPHRRGWCGTWRSGTHAGLQFRCEGATAEALSLTFPGEQFPDGPDDPGGWIDGDYIPF